MWNRLVVDSTWDSVPFRNALQRGMGLLVHSQPRIAIAPGRLRFSMYFPIILTNYFLFLFLEIKGFNNMKCLSYCRIVGGEAEKGSKSGCRSEKGNKDREEQGKQLQTLTRDPSPQQKKQI